MTEVFDVAIAGAGLSGVLAAMRLKALKPNLNILLLEKEDIPGGRLRSSRPEISQWSSGLGGLSEDLFEFWKQTIRALPESPDFPKFPVTRQNRFGVLQGSAMSHEDLKEIVTAKGAKAMGGMAASRHWSSVNPLVGQHVLKTKPSPDSSVDKQSFGSLWGESKKHPAGVVMEYFAGLFGIPNLWSAQFRSVLERSTFFSKIPIVGPWDEALEEQISFLEKQGHFVFKSKCRLLKVFQDETTEWHLETEGGLFSSRTLIVAQTPWQALDWMPRRIWPTSCLQVATKSKPVSVVTLVGRLLSEVDLPEIIMIPAEGVHAFINFGSELVLQATRSEDTRLNSSHSRASRMPSSA